MSWETAALIRSLIIAAATLSTSAVAQDADLLTGLEAVRVPSSFRNAEQFEIVGMRPGDMMDAVLSRLTDDAIRVEIGGEQWSESSSQFGREQTPTVATIVNSDGRFDLQASPWTSGSVVYRVERSTTFLPGDAPDLIDLKKALIAKYGEPSVQRDYERSVVLSWFIHASEKSPRECPAVRTDPNDTDPTRRAGYSIVNMDAAAVCEGYVRLSVDGYGGEGPPLARKLEVHAVDIRQYLEVMMADAEAKEEVRRRIRTAPGTSDKLPNL